MKADLENYTPTNPEFVLDERVSEEFPHELDFRELPGIEAMDNKRDMLRFIGKTMTATFPENEYVMRKMDDFEKKAIRGEYCSLVENILPERKKQLEDALEEAKRMKKEAEELYSSTLQEINSYAAEVKMGTREVRLKSTDTFCIALAGYYLTYTWNEDKQVFLLAKGVKIPDHTDVFASDENNRQQLLDLFGLEFPTDDRYETKEEEESEQENDEF